MLTRDYFFEFAGMPKSGKTTVLDVVVHYLKRMGLRVGEYHGGGRYSPVDKSSIVSLNFWLASKAVEFIVVAAEREKVYNRVYLMDRGLVDRTIFTDVLIRRGTLGKASGETTMGFLTLPELMGRLDGVFIFVTSPELSLRREYANKLVQAEGRVMNTKFLQDLRTGAIESLERVKPLIAHTHLIDTEQENGQQLETARRIADAIMQVIEGEAK